MIRTILIDLDDTLIGNQMTTFVPAYVQALSAHMAASVPPDRFASQLLVSTRRMLQNRDPERTLAQVFSDDFYPSLQTSQETLRPGIEDFYARQFASLESLTSYRPEARPLIENLLALGLEVVIATNPLFPRTAIEQRLAWAGVPVDKYPYALVTSFESFRFAKPDLGYYAQILGALGRAPYETAMIGNDVEADLDPARSLGMATFHISSSPANNHPGGGLEAVLPWLERNAEEQLNRHAASQPAAVLGRLRGHLAAFLEMTHSVDSGSWLHSPAPGEWSALEILCHMRDVEREVHQERLHAILEQEQLFIPHVDPDPWAQERDYLCQSPVEALDGFSKARQETIRFLTHMQSESWARLARHALLGPVTLAEVAAIAPEHDQLHLAQLLETIPSLRHD